MALVYFSLGPDAEKNAQRDLGALLRVARRGASQDDRARAPKDADSVKQFISAFEGNGCDELILFPSRATPTRSDCLPRPPSLGAQQSASPSLFR